MYRYNKVGQVCNLDCSRYKYSILYQELMNKLPVIDKRLDIHMTQSLYIFKSYVLLVCIIKNGASLIKQIRH
jgi:hypothetical protein